MAKLSTSRLVFTSAYGDRDPIKTAAGVTESFHYGVDYGPEKRNTPGIVLRAVIGGRATWLSDQYGALGVRVTSYAYGDLLTLLRRLYGGVVEGARVTFDLWHLASRLVPSATDVAEGAPVGVMGSTGRSTGIHTHAELRIGGKVVDPKPFIDAQASKAVAPAPDDYYGEGFLMALSESEQEQIKNDVTLIRAALVKEAGGGRYYMPDAIVDVIRKEVKPNVDAVAKALLDPKQYGFAPIDIIVTHVTATLKALTAQAKEQGIDVSADEIVDELAKRLANG